MPSKKINFPRKKKKTTHKPPRTPQSQKSNKLPKRLKTPRNGKHLVPFVLPQPSPNNPSVPLPAFVLQSRKRKALSSKLRRIRKATNIPPITVTPKEINEILSRRFNAPKVSQTNLNAALDHLKEYPINTRILNNIKSKKKKSPP